jgi:hypothetical protein
MLDFSFFIPRIYQASQGKKEGAQRQLHFAGAVIAPFPIFLAPWRLLLIPITLSL